MAASVCCVIDCMVCERLPRQVGKLQVPKCGGGGGTAIHQTICTAGVPTPLCICKPSPGIKRCRKEPPNRIPVDARC